LTIHTICSDAQRILVAATPDFLPGLRFSAVPEGMELDDIDNGRDTMRSLKVFPGPVTGQGHFTSALVYSTKQTLRVGIRYLLDPQAPGAADRIDAMWGSDIALFVKTLTRPPLDAGWTVPHYGIRFKSADQLAQGEWEDSLVCLGLCEFEVDHP
jgi:hypothetical protein